MTAFQSFIEKISFGRLSYAGHTVLDAENKKQVYDSVLSLAVNKRIKVCMCECICMCVF